LNIFSNSFAIEYDEVRDAVLIWHPDRQLFPRPLVEIRNETLQGMSFDEASRFIGSRLLLLMPALREMFRDYLWTEDGQSPQKN
jgi:hypothetical protein